jgi:hypothetical protein
MSKPSHEDILAFMDDDERQYWDSPLGGPKGTLTERGQFWKNLEELWLSIPDPTLNDLKPPYMHVNDWSAYESGSKDVIPFHTRRWKKQRKAEATARRVQERVADLSISLDDTLQKPKELSLELDDDAGGAMREAVGKPGSEMDVPTPDKWLPETSSVMPPEAERNPPSYKDTRVPGQQAAPTEQERMDAELLAFMSKQVRASYEKADVDQRAVIWEANKRAFEAAQKRKQQKFLRDRERMEKVLDMLQRVKEDPDKAHLLPPANASIPELHEWFDEMSKPVDRPSFPAFPHQLPDQVEPQNIPSASKIEASKLDTSEKVSWIHRIPVWKEFGHWLKWASGCFAFALGMTQVNEYAWALAGLIGCGICCIAQIYVWTASPSRFKNRITKLLLALISLTMIMISGLTVLKIRGDKPLSNLISVNKQAALPKPVSSTELKPLPRFSNFMQEPRPIHDGGYLIYKVAHPADLSPIEFYARLGMLNGEEIRVVVYVVRPYQVSLVAATIAQHYETIVEHLKAEAKEKGFLDTVVSRTVVIHVDLSGGEPISIPKEARRKGINFEIERRLV